MENKTNYYALNTTALAFLGDAVYEAYVRERILRTGEIHSDMLHRIAVTYVCAGVQAKILRRLFPELTPEEEALAKRARNRKSASKPKNADPVDYKLATAFEALIGWLSLSGQKERMEELIFKAMEIAEEKDGECEEGPDSTK
ncbi:MAG: ribonuclease III [Firmicutes bacterium]|nr:ribonuclease III [Bacillota bacterium]